MKFLTLKFSDRSLSSLSYSLRQRFCDDNRKYDVLRQLEGDKQWIQSEEAKRLFNERPVIPTESLRVDSMIEYIKSREFLCKSKNSTRFLSSLLTFPLTLSYGLRNSIDHKDKINTIIVGARAESTLPVYWWKEIVFSCRQFNNLQLSMVGPHIKYDRNKLQSIARYSFNIDNQQRSMNVMPCVETDACYFHSHPQLTSLLTETDVFILYNPGYGSPIIMTSWYETISLLLKSNKVIIATAHSEYDLERDKLRLNELATQLNLTIDMILKPHRNPFASLRQTIDENETDNRAQIITPNGFIYAVKAKES
jgi:hypothetical protein